MSPRGRAGTASPRNHAGFELVVLLLTRLSGKRPVGQHTPFDMLVIVLLGTVVNCCTQR